MSVNRLHVIGDRQAGKTDMALAYASSLIHNGVNVAIYTVDFQYVSHLVETYDMRHLHLGQTVYRSNGRQRVRDDSSGATLYFSTARAHEAALRGVHVGTAILDEQVCHWDDFTLEMRHPGLTHIVRTVL